MPAREFSLGKPLGWAVLIWLVGFAWGSIVFMVPALKNLPSIPYVSRYPAISFPLLVVFPVLAFRFSKSVLQPAAQKVAAGLQVGAIFAGINCLLDLLVLVLAFQTGFGFFTSVTVWLGYALLFAAPWTLGHLWESWYSQ